MLVVEDDPAVRNLADEILRMHGYVVISAATAEEAIRRAKAHAGTVHLLLTDVVLPGMNGYALAEKIRAMRPETRVLFMSGYPFEELSRNGTPTPGAGLIEKPFGAHRFAQRVREVLDGPREASRV